MLNRFISYYRPHRLLLYSDLLAALLASLIGILYPITTRRMLTDYIPNRLYSSIITAGIFLLALYIVRMLLNYFMQFYGHVMCCLNGFSVFFCCHSCGRCGLPPHLQMVRQ